MEFALSEEQVLLKDNVDRLLADASPLDTVRSYADGSQPTVPLELWQQLTELGISSLLIPEPQGGLALTALEAALVAESTGAAVAPTPLLGSGIMAPYLLSHCGDQDTLLAGLAGGDVRLGIAFSERTGAREDAGVTSNGTTLSGRALHVLDFETASAYLVADQNGHVHLVEGDAEGINAQVLTTIDRTRSVGELRFNSVPSKCISDDPAVLDATIELGRLALAADTLGAASHMLEEAVTYAKQREQFNRPIASFQAVKHLCAEMAAALEPCRAMVWYAAHAFSEGDGDATMIIRHTKAHTSEVGKRLAKTATEVHGGMGFTDLLGLHYWFKRIGFNRQTLGTPERLRREAAAAQGLIAGHQ